MKTKVYLRQLNEYKTVDIKDEDLSLETTLIEKWQKYLDLLVKIIGIKAALIMQITKENMEVFTKSSNLDNPYPEHGKDKLGHGLYCETVIGENRKLYVPDALKDDKWKDNPDVKLNMISYFGYPLKYPDGDFFGTICILNDTKIILQEDIEEWMSITRDIIEKDLQISLQNKLLKKHINEDYLTKLSSRQKLFEFLEMVQHDCERQLYHYGVVMFDIKHFKNINDEYGHQIGDKVLKAVGEVMRKRVRQNDLVARFGGDEFVLVAKNVTAKQIKKIIDDYIDGILNDTTLQRYNIQLSRGYAISDENTKDYESLIEKADHEMYENKGC